ncbi:DUF6884 domain-containing protein [Halorubrum ezzemoulense]|uniref:DUF6884 domain-containing protein n=1 Tax=Halorubrum ezzemoulense TaxID=337243 RepID=UPI00232F76AB|nr:DUF6884 domain-containing protein [Halorubrum ezzemoulense]MDB9253943.1 hypothetical protein [Halorubrum ezzemoulense]MDB9257137.1 hypothetical protein [Halorubrum ezzemoulense]MDB9277947.1 hypothetical protein [Halorubrum ezzemoulense]
MEVGFVRCVKSKREAAKPKELYLESAFFRKARQYVEANHDAWYILSAKHHLLDPDGESIEPYDETLSGAPIDTKREWAETVFEQLREEGLLGDGNRLVFHAGRDYHEELTPLLSETSVEFSVPTDGLQFGETLAWYNDHI